MPSTYCIRHSDTLGDLTETELQILLDASGIGSDLTIDDKLSKVHELKEELDRHDSQLSFHIVRDVSVSVANIYHIGSNTDIYFLQEARQVFRSGRVRERNMKFSISEKIRLHELPNDAIIRGIREELGIITPIVIKFLGVIHEVRESGTFPIPTIYTIYQYRVLLDDTQYNQNGYIEHQEDKDTYFSWKVLP